MNDDPVAGFIGEQPTVVAATLVAAQAAFAGLASSPIAGIALVGSGSSMNALTAAAPTLRATGRGPVALRSPLAFLDDVGTLARQAGLAVVLSQSGASRTSIEAARAAIDAGLRVLLVTAEAASPFAALPAERFVMPIGPEPIGPKTKGYAASVAALLALAAALGAPAAAPADVEAALAPAIAPARTAAAALAGREGELDFVLVCGRGRHLGTAMEGALKIAEMAGVPAAACDTEEALHGRFHGLTPQSLVVFVTGDRADARMAAAAQRVLADLGLAAVHVATGDGGDFCPLPPLPAPWDILTAIVPLQWLAHALARRRGLPPARMRYPGMSQRLAIKTDTQP